MTELRWRRVDDYHARSECGRFSVARINVAPRIWYVAFRLPFSEARASTELGATSVLMEATEDERTAAIVDMKKLCEDEA